jgi:hypothetical protein
MIKQHMTAPIGGCVAAFADTVKRGDGAPQ